MTETQRTLCLCNSTLAWGGGEKWHLDTAVSLHKRGWRIILLCHPQGALFTRAKAHSGLEVVPLPIGRLSFLNPFQRLRLAAFLCKEQVQAVIMNLPADLKCVGPAAKQAGVRHILYRRGSAIPVKNSLLNRRLYGHVITGLIANSEATKRTVLQNNPHLIPQEAITVLPNGIDIAAFTQALALSAPLPLQGDISRQPLVLGNAGRLNRQKGQHYLLYLGQELLQRGLPVHLIIAGTGEREQELRCLARKLDIEPHVQFTGFLEDLSPFWRRIDVFILSSLWEGFGYVLVEAMLAEKPIAAFRVSNIPELVAHGENGFLVPVPEQYAAVPDMGPMADAVERLYDADLRKRMGERGRIFAENNFSQEKCMDTLEKLLQR